MPSTPTMMRANARALRKGEFSAIAVAYASTTMRATSTEASRAVVRDAMVEACERAAATRWKPSSRELDDVLRGVRASLVDNDDERVFELVCALVEVDGAIEAFVEHGLAADVGRRTRERRPQAARGLEACRAIVRRVGESTSGVSAIAVVDALKPALRFAQTVLKSKLSTSAAAVQAALFLARACDVVGHVDVEDDWRIKARAILESNSISVHTLVGPMVKYMSAAKVNEAARAELKRAARVTAPVLLPPEPLVNTSAMRREESADDDNIATAVAPLDEQFTPGTSHPLSTSTPIDVADVIRDEMCNNQRRDRVRVVDTPFATRRHFECNFETQLPASTKLDDLFFYEIDAMCAYADQFEETLALTLKWMRKCAATLRRSVLRKVNLTSNRPMEHVLRCSLDTHLTALTRLLKLAKIIGARNLMLANEDKALISSYNIERWISSAFGWIRVAARKEQSLTSYAVMVMCCYDPNGQRFSKTDYIPVRLAFTRWSRLMYAHRVQAKRQLLALVHYENSLLRKSFDVLREFAPYHRERVADLARIAGLRWRANAHVMATRVGSGTMDDELDIAYPEDMLFGESPGGLISCRPPSRRDSFALMSSNGAPSTSGPARSRKTHSAVSKSSMTSVGEHDEPFDAVELDSAFTSEKMLMYDAFQAWIEQTYVQLSTGPNGSALRHRNETLMRKAFKAMRRYVVRSVGAREKYVAIEQAARSLDFYVTGGAAFKRWIAGVRYIKRLYAFVDEEVERWTVELRVNCFHAWREIAASRSAATLWEEQMLADIMPTMENNRRRVWLKRWSFAAQALIERHAQFARAHYTKTLLRQWHARTQASIVSRIVASALDKLSLS